MRCWRRKVIIFALVIIIALAGCRSSDVVPEAQQSQPQEYPMLETSPTPVKLTPEKESPQPTLFLQNTRRPAIPEQPAAGIELNFFTSNALELAAELGAHWIRRNSLKWSSIEPIEGMRAWDSISALEDEIQALTQYGIQTILIVNSSPDWALTNPGKDCSPVAYEQLSAFASFMYDAVKRYSVPPYSVKYWELGNEPDVDPDLVPLGSPYGCWGDKSDIYYGGGYYAEMLKRVYPQIKAADPQAQVLVGGLLLDCDPVNPPEGKDCSPSLFMEGILRSGGGNFFDGISFHAYDYYSGSLEYGNSNWKSSSISTGPVVSAKARYLRSLLASYEHPEKFIMNTEAGLICGFPDGSPECKSAEYEQTKVIYIAEVYAAALAEKLRANIWYSLTGWRGTGLISDRGEKLPAFQAFQTSARQLDGARYVRMISDIPGLRGYELERGSKRIQIIWSIDEQEHAFPLDKKPEAIFNVFGEKSETADTEIQVGRSPLYIVWGS